MRQRNRTWNRTGDEACEATTTDTTTTDADRLAGSTMISLGYHREGVGVNSKDAEKEYLKGFTDAGVTVASTAFVLAGVALSTVPAVML